MAFALQLFGGFRLTAEDGQLIQLPGRARALLAYLAVASSAVSRQQLAELLSQDGSEQEQRTALRQAVYLVRKAMADPGAIRTPGDHIALNETLVRADVRLFRDAIAQADDRSLQEAVALHHGPLLYGEGSPSTAFEEWLSATRADFLAQTVDALLNISKTEGLTERYDSALAHARRALRLEPLREDAHRQVMQHLASMGQRSNALLQYDALRQSLAEELGVSPEPETEALREAIARGQEQPRIVAESPRTASIVAPARREALPNFRYLLHGSRVSIAALAASLVIVASLIAAWSSQTRSLVSSEAPSIAVLPFRNVSGDAAQDYLGQGIVAEITMMLTTYPEITVLSRAGRVARDPAERVEKLGRDLGVGYVLDGDVSRSADKIHITAQLIDVGTGHQLWARRFDEQGDDLVAIQEQIANRIYESLVGSTGAIETEEQRRAWQKSGPTLEEQDYLLRGQQFYFQFSQEAHARAREIWQAGLLKFPDSKRLRLSLAVNYRHGVEVGWSEHPDQDLENAWRLGGEASLIPDHSRSERWLTHWVMAKLAQWCKEDFERSVAEARAAIKIVPYDATSRADLAELMANAGRSDDAIEWLQEAVQRDPEGPEWYRGNLAWAYYLAGRYEDALAELKPLRKPRRLLLAALYSRLGRADDAHAVLTEFLKDNPGHSLADEARWPLIAPARRTWLRDLRGLGVPEEVPSNMRR